MPLKFGIVTHHSQISNANCYRYVYVQPILMKQGSSDHYILPNSSNLYIFINVFVIIPKYLGLACIHFLHSNHQYDFWHSRSTDIYYLTDEWSSALRICRKFCVVTFSISKAFARILYALPLFKLPFIRLLFSPCQFSYVFFQIVPY